MKLLLELSVTVLLMMPLLVLGKESFFSGRWSSIEMIAGQHKPYSTFTITASENESGEIRGAYCFITWAGNRIDCGSDGDFNISGRVGNNKKMAAVNFYSFFGAVGGVAEMTIDGDRLLWKVIKQPTGGDYYGPVRIEMRRSDFSGRRPGKQSVVVDRVFLHDAPSNSKVSRIFLEKGDSVELIDVSSDAKFWKIEFLSKNGRRFVGWIDCLSVDFCAK
ncbi:hypothetical protein [Burkholderia contaminans]|uniref:hypothetical protein n=1 Tax=Burkholderia contaminans TaxID=488447 RepID=UPI001589AFD7|nr:hypothetical protein [Burkholderia contaminans]